jgi:peroxiredoxin
MDEKDIVERLGEPDKIIGPEDRMRSPGWVCSTCRSATAFAVPMPVPRRALGAVVSPSRSSTWNRTDRSYAAAAVRSVPGVQAGHSHGAGNMSEEGAHSRSALPIAASLAEFTDKLIARRGVEQANVLFGGQIGPATQALSARTRSIGVGDLAPDFSLPTAEGATWSLAEHLAQGNFSSLVLVFYRGTWCGYCNIYLRGLLAIRLPLLEANAGLIAVSPEAAPDSTADANADPTFPILIDNGGKVAEQFGLTFEMDDAAKSVLKNSGFHIDKRNADGRWTLPVPGTFVINRSGHIAYAHVDADYRNRPEPQEIVAMCRSLQR